MFYSRAQVTKLFTDDLNKSLLTSAILEKEKSRDIPKARKNDVDKRKIRGWSTSDLPELGEKFGFLKKPERPLVYSFFVTKGGVFKTALALNTARMAALHNIRTLVIGLDMQCDITTAMGHMDDDDTDDLETALRWMENTQGLYDVFLGHTTVRQVLKESDIPNLCYIPETPELVALEQNLLHRPRREQWLQENVIHPLRHEFDLFVLDCSPNWNQLITNSLVAADVLISPLECKINNFRNLKMFRAFIGQVQRDLQLHFRQFYVPTRLSLSRRLSQDIFAWYRENLPNCLDLAVRDHALGEEATALNLSVPEYQPGSSPALEMNRILKAIWLPNLANATSGKKRDPKYSDAQV